MTSHRVKGGFLRKRNLISTWVCHQEVMFRGPWLINFKRVTTVKR